MNDVTGMPQSAVVLGGGSEIGLAVLRELAARRLRTVVLAGPDLARMEPNAAALRRLGLSVATVGLDLRETGRLRGAAEAARASLGSVDLVLVAAGVLGSSELEGLTPEAVAESVSVNFTGPAAAIAAFLPLLEEQGQGRIVVLSSVAGVRVRRANLVYGAAKAGLDGYCQGLQDALAGSAVGLTIVRPGFVRTKMTAGRRAQPLAVGPEEVAAAVVRGLEAGTELIWVPASLRLAFPALAALPRALWRRLPA